MIFMITNISKVVLMFSMLMEVADGIGKEEHLGFLDASQEAHFLLGVKVLTTKQFKFPALNNDGSIQWEQQISKCRKRPPSEG